MKAYFAALLAAAIQSAAQGAIATEGTGLQTVGIASGASAIAGVLGFIISHPNTHPVVKATVAVAVAKITPAP